MVTTMSLYYYGLLTVFAIVVVMIAIDPNVGVFIDLQLKNLVVQVKRLWYLMTIGAQVKYNNWKLMREISKIRKERGLTDE